MPSAVRPFAVCQSFNAVSVAVPKMPSMVAYAIPSFACNLLTGSPMAPLDKTDIFYPNLCWVQLDQGRTHLVHLQVK